MRERLPDRRASTTFEVEALGLGFTVTVSRYSDDRPAEIFITNHRAGSAASIMASDAAICASLALQHNCPVDVLRKALSRDSQGNATSPLGCALDLIEEVRDEDPHLAVVIEQARNVGDRRQPKIESAAGAVFPAIEEQE
jgi:hypothetical protein